MNLLKEFFFSMSKIFLFFYLFLSNFIKYIVIQKILNFLFFIKNNFYRDLAKKLKEFENKLKIEYNLNFQDNYSKKDSKGLIVHVAKENNKENEEENKNNVFAV